MHSRFLAPYGRDLTSFGESLFICPFCSLWRKSLFPSAARVLPTRSRRASSVASFTAVNATKVIPPKFRALYDALKEVKKKAAAQVSLSRVELALQGLESEEPTIRVAVAAYEGSNAARKMVRLLLADPLEQETEWERKLAADDADGRGLLIRYGQAPTSLFPSPSGSMPTLAVPSRVLRKNNLEILLTSFAGLTTYPDGPVTPPSSLVPTADIPTAASGRHTLVVYPVHKSLSVISLLDLVKRTIPIGTTGKAKSAHLVQSVLLSMDATNAMPEEDLHELGLLGMVDPTKAEDGLKAFRRSLDNAAIYEHKWMSSGIPEVTGFLAARGDAPGQALNAVVEGLIYSLLEDALENLDAQRMETDRVRVGVGITSAEDKLALNEAIATWAERSHAELRDTLDQAFSSEQWHRLVWWKLFWRVDDVAIILSDILEKGWLPRSEKDMLVLAGRLEQAGLVSAQAVPLDLPGYAQTEKPVVTVEVKPQIQTQIEQFRGNIALHTIPPLQALAQRLVLTSLMVTASTSALSALMYASISTTSVYESATVAALGLVVSLRHIQKKWGAACAFWKREMREEGRKALRNTERAMSSAVNVEPAPLDPPLELVAGEEARQSVEKAKQALMKLTR